jgi:hypothetical protein
MFSSFSLSTAPRPAAASARSSNFRSGPRDHAALIARCVLQCSLLIALLHGCESSLPSDRNDGAAHDAGSSRDAASVRDASTSDDASSSPDAFAVDAATPDCDCFDGPGQYCEADVAARAAEAGCNALSARATGHRLLACDDATGWSSSATCADGCETGETGASAECSLPVCDCFVREAWCGASAARHGLGLDPPCRVPLVPEHDTDILGCDGATWIVRTACAEGCFEAPTGTADACIEDRGTPTDPGWPACAHHGLIHWGVHPEASDRLRCAGVTDSMITQTIGSAAASAGYHAQDGTVDGAPYTAAIDLSVRGLDSSEIRSLLARLGENGFAAWYRQPGHDGWPSSEAAHIHAVFAGVVMKAELRGQVRDYLVGRNGLASHTHYSFWSPSAATLDIIRLLFTRHYTP